MRSGGSRNADSQAFRGYALPPRQHESPALQKKVKVGHPSTTGTSGWHLVWRPVVGYFEFSADPFAKATYQSVARPRNGINIKTDSQGLNPHFLKIRQNGTSSTKAIHTINSKCIG
jgi:hypothetical protein